METTKAARAVGRNLSSIFIILIAFEFPYFSSIGSFVHCQYLTPFLRHGELDSDVAKALTFDKPK
ncbi:hypothetical protein jaqu_38780 [Jannaschia aquimarina]|uniref:Uncharacterized protein n=1 Tax=Jannaschia aquimarina TaxID=935700 RepID=A0A0D1E9P8_9RHOB|nr:hypothetical protein jaqu_38780 [Jannaschia aquimarina]SNT44726.1 hypothetical protein SAMN05421775_1293 [Jannaschia aquimarina]